MSKNRKSSDRSIASGGRGESSTSKKRSGSMTRFIIMIALIVIVAGGLTALTLSMPDEVLPQPSVPAQATTTTPGPYEYDPVTNRHWHPGHGHWHDGPPPELTAQSGDGVSAPPGVTNPAPWQYDEGTDRHYDPGHAHWHSGRPPAGVDANTLVSPVSSDRVDPPPGITNPTPWQYDDGTDRHFHPGHGHWHGGPPPPPSDR